LTALAAMPASVSSVEAEALLPERMHECREIELAQHGVREIAIRPLDHQAVQIFTLAAQIGEIVLAAPLALHFAGILIKRPSLPDQVERDVGHGKVFFQHRRMAAPFRQAMAEDQVIVGEPEQKGDEMVARNVHHMCPTSSGIL
jgi:hypothetical protein